MANAPAALSSASGRFGPPGPQDDWGQQALSRRARARERSSRDRGARNSRAARRERRRQIDAAQDPFRRARRGCRRRSSSSASPSSFASPHDAQRAGIVTIYQEFTLAPDMTIAENVFIGREPGSRLFVSWRRLAEDTRAITDKIGLRRDPMTPRARPLGRRAAAGRDRPRAFHAVAAHRHGRADLGAERNRSRQPRPHHPGAQGRGTVDHLRHSSAGGGVPPLRPLHGAARRAFRRLRRGRRHECRRHHSDDGRPGRRRALRRTADPEARSGRARGRGPDTSAHRAGSTRDRAR